MLLTLLILASSMVLTGSITDVIRYHKAEKHSDIVICIGVGLRIAILLLAIWVPYLS